MELNDAAVFWEMHFGKIMGHDEFVKKYLYNIQHMYGKVGGRKSYTPYSCNKIIMGETPIPSGEIYHAVEGANGELGYYLISDGGRTPYRLHFRRPCFIYYQAYPEMIQGSLLSDAILTMSSMNVIAGELDA
jgi:NADH:ubiquinone oxidoreductase subunit D